MIRRLVDGEWSDEEFLVVPPGYRVRPNHRESILALEAAP